MNSKNPDGTAPVSRANQAAARERIVALLTQLLVLTPQPDQFIAFRWRATTSTFAFTAPIPMVGDSVTQ